VPYQITLTDTPLFDTGPFRWLAIPLWLIGAAVMFWCAWDFTVKGRGTPAPIDPPREADLHGYIRGKASLPEFQPLANLGT
jgi:hypothetical protein